MAMPANLARVTGTPAAEDGPWPWVNGALIPPGPRIGFTRKRARTLMRTRSAARVAAQGVLLLDTNEDLIVCFGGSTLPHSGQRRRAVTRCALLRSRSSSTQLGSASTCRSDACCSLYRVRLRERLRSQCATSLASLSENSVT